MGLDIRVPLGLIFLIIGGIMAVFGLATHADAGLYERSLGVNLNLAWGATMFVFGAIMFYVGRQKKWQDAAADPRPWEKARKAKRRH